MWHVNPLVSFQCVNPFASFWWNGHENSYVKFHRCMAWLQALQSLDFWYLCQQLFLDSGDQEQPFWVQWLKIGSTDEHILSIWHWYKFTEVIKVGVHVFILENLFKAIHFGCLLSTFLFVTLNNSTTFKKIACVLLFQTTSKISLVDYICRSANTWIPPVENFPSFLSHNKQSDPQYWCWHQHEPFDYLVHHCKIIEINDFDNTYFLSHDFENSTTLICSKLMSKHITITIKIFIATFL